jgi:hypothetical protein
VHTYNPSYSAGGRDQKDAIQCQLEQKVIETPISTQKQGLVAGTVIPATQEARDRRIEI